MVSLLADVREVGEFFQDSLWSWVAMALAVGALFWVVFKLSARLREDSDPAAERVEMLMAFGDLHREGRLSDEEYRSIKSKLTHGDGTDATSHLDA